MVEVGYRSLITKIKSVISAGAGLNTNLSREVMQVVSGDPFIVPVPNNLYPTIFVDLVDKEEVWGSLGDKEKSVTLTLNVYCLVFLQATADNSDTEVQYLADNVEEIIRGNTNLDNTVDWATPTTCDFATGFKDGVHLSCAVIELKVFKLIS